MPPLSSSRLPLRHSTRLLRLLHSSPEPRDRASEIGSVACRLTSRSVIGFSGPDTFKFLQGLVTNDVRRLSAPDPDSSPYFPTPNVGVAAAPAMYVALLTPQGRFLYDMVLYRPPKGLEKLGSGGSGPGDDAGGSGFEVIADVDSEVVDEMLDYFKKYRLRSKVEVENMTKEFSCWQRFGHRLVIDHSSTHDPEAESIGWGSGIDHAGASSAEGNNYGWCWYKDPRLSSLGFRGIFPSETIPPLVEADKTVVQDHYLLWRLELGVAEGSLEILKGEAIPLEYNLVGLNAISFDKGCYVGQEFVARTHHRGVIRKRLLPFRFVNGSGQDVEMKIAPGSEVVESATNKKAGTLSLSFGSHGMGVLRLEDALKSHSLFIKDQDDIKVKVMKPDWWPAEWTHDIEQQGQID